MWQTILRFFGTQTDGLRDASKIAECDSGATFGDDSGGWLMGMAGLSDGV
jgi:hypothetical protein